MSFVIVGIGAGCAAALLFAAMTSGTLLSIPLFYLAPLPILIAGLGWSHWAALIAAGTGALALTGVFGSVFLLVFLAAAGLPAWWLSYLAMLARPVTNGATTLEWYPPGRMVIWAAAFGGLSIAAAFLYFGLDAEHFRASLRESLTQILGAGAEVPADAAQAFPKAAHRAELLTLLVAAVPPTAAVITTITSLINLWLAGIIVKFSGRLQRPWPVLADMTFPRPLAAALALAVVLSFVSGMVGILAGAVAACLLMAYAVLGFAVLHAITRGMSSRMFLLGGVYTAVLILGWPVLALSILGLAETAIDLRARISQTRGPPAPT